MNISQDIPRVLVCGHVHCTACSCSLLEVDIITCQACFQDTQCLDVDMLPVWTRSMRDIPPVSRAKQSTPRNDFSTRSCSFSPTLTSLSSFRGRKLSVVGEGSFGAASRWYMHKMRTTVVLKLTRKVDYAGVALLKSEYNSLQALNHPNIIENYGMFHFQKTHLALALPYYPDGDVAYYLKENKWCTGEIMYIMVAAGCHMLSH